MIRALGVVKRAAAEANLALGKLDPKIAEAIVAAAQEVIDGKLDRPFPAGGVADRFRHPVEHDRQPGAREPRHRDAGRSDGFKNAEFTPNDHVNMSQSSNDTYPTAMHIACAEEVARSVMPALEHLHAALKAKSAQFDHIHIKIGRTLAGRDTPDAPGRSSAAMRTRPTCRCAG